MNLRTLSCLAALTVLAACTPSSPTAQKIEKGLDQLKAGIEANAGDCKKMADSIQAPVNDVVSGLKEAQAKQEKLPASTKLKMAGVVAAFQGLGPCAKSPEMVTLVQTVATSAAAQ